jgi:hypothetical protein
LALLVAIPAFAADSTVAFDPNQVVARVGPSVVTLGPMAELVFQRNMYRSNALEDQERRKALLEAIIDDTLFALEARKESLKDNWGALARTRRGVTLAAADMFLQEYVITLLRLDSATIDTFYNNHITRYSAPYDQRRARVLTVWKEGQSPNKSAEKFKDSLYANWYPEDKIDSLYTRLCNGEDFAKLALNHSEDHITRGNGGDLGWVSLRAMEPSPLSEKILTQPLHLISKPIETPIGWHIAQVTEERAAGPVPLNDEIRREIMSHLVEQQKNLILKEMGDSLQAVADIKWNETVSAMSHEELRSEMVFVVINRRDTIFAEEYLMEAIKWRDRAANAFPDADRRGEILRGEYVRLSVWYGYLRENGYLDHPEIVALRDHLLQAEREAITRTRVASVKIPEPDSNTITKYYQDSIHIYGTAPTALTFAWNSIKSKLQNDMRIENMRQWRKRMYASYGVKRYDDVLAQLPFLEHTQKKP